MDDIKTRIFVQCFLHFAKKKSDMFLNVKGILFFNRISLKKKVGVFVCAKKSKRRKISMPSIPKKSKKKKKKEILYHKKCREILICLMGEML